MLNFQRAPLFGVPLTHPNVSHRTAYSQQCNGDGRTIRFQYERRNCICNRPAIRRSSYSFICHYGSRDWRGKQMILARNCLSSPCTELVPANIPATARAPIGLIGVAHSGTTQNFTHASSGITNFGTKILFRLSKIKHVVHRTPVCIHVFERASKNAFQDPSCLASRAPKTCLFLAINLVGSLKTR